MGVTNESAFILQITNSKNTGIWPIGSYLFWDKEPDDDADYPKGPGWRPSRDPKEARKFITAVAALTYWGDSKAADLGLIVRVRKLEVRTTISNVD